MSLFDKIILFMFVGFATGMLVHIQNNTRDQLRLEIYVTDSSFDRCMTLMSETFHGFDSSDSFCNHIVYGEKYEPLIPFPDL